MASPEDLAQPGLSPLPMPDAAATDSAHCVYSVDTSSTGQFGASQSVAPLCIASKFVAHSDSSAI